MGVDLRRRYVGMSKHHLDASQVRPALQKVRGETVAQDVRGEVPKDAHPFPMSRKKLPESLSGQPAASRRYKEISASPAAQKRRTGGLQVSTDGRYSLSTHRDHPLLPSLTRYCRR